jgi:cytochrome c-type biogenesis protein CcmF
MVVPAWGAHVRDPRLMAGGDPAALCQFGLLLVSFLALTYAYVSSDLSVANGV